MLNCCAARKRAPFLWDAREQLLINRQHAIAYPKRGGLWVLLASEAQPYRPALLTAKDSAVAEGHELVAQQGKPQGKPDDHAQPSVTHGEASGETNGAIWRGEQRRLLLN